MNPANAAVLEDLRQQIQERPDADPELTDEQIAAVFDSLNSELKRDVEANESHRDEHRKRLTESLLERFFARLGI